MSSPKFTWDSATAGSLILKISDGDREIIWKITKRSTITRIREICWEMESILDEYNPRFERIPGVNAEPTEAEWSALPMQETVRTVDQEELDALREAKSRRELADKAASVTLTGANFWGHSDLDDLELVTMGTGDPE